MDKLYEIKKKVADYIKINRMLERGDVVAAGVSGGADSMCLLNILMDMRETYDLRIAVVHVHHGIRGSEADGDMEYVESFCREHMVEFYGVRYDIPGIARENHLSGEEAGRIKRYETFETVLRQLGAGNTGKIAVAHNMEDSSETFLLNLFRGTGLKGLAGIQPARGQVIRPVRCLTRQEILQYLEEKGVSYRTDSTNSETDYTRNRIRLRLLPYIRENINAGAVSNISRAADMLGEISSYMDRQAAAAYGRYAVYNREKGQCRISMALWQEDGIIIKMVIRMAVEAAAGRLKDITALHIESIAELAANTVSKAVDIPYGLRAVRTYEGVVIGRREERQADFENVIDISRLTAGDGDGESCVEVAAGGGILTFCIEKNKCIDLTENLYTKWMDYGILKDKLSVRSRRAGDYMVIGAGGQRKKLKDILIDLKIPRDERDNLILLAKGQEILWIVGVRMSERCKITQNDDGGAACTIVRAEYREPGQTT